MNMLKCSKCNRPMAITVFHTAKHELCLDCAIEALNILKTELPSMVQFINRWVNVK